MFHAVITISQGRKSRGGPWLMEKIFWRTQKNFKREKHFIPRVSTWRTEHA